MTTNFLGVPVGQLVLERPSRAAVFERFGIDYCCGGKLTLERACQVKKVDPNAVADALAAADAPEAEPTVDWRSVSLADVVGYIVRAYHDPLRQALARLRPLAEKVARVHGDHHPYLPALAGVFQQFGAEMEAHMDKEEQVLFPLIAAIEAGNAGPRGGMVGQPIRVMEAEHEDAGRQLEQMRELTSGYQLPEDACNSFRALYHGLEEVERELHLHVHLENEVLFPRALALVEAAAGSVR